MYISLIVLYLFLYTIFAWKHTKGAVMLTLFALPSYLIRFHVAGIPITLLEVMILVLFVVTLVKKRGRLRFEGWFWLMALLVAASVTALWVTPDMRAGLGLFKAYILEPMFFFLVVVTLFRKNEIDQLVLPLGFSAAAVSFCAILQYLTGVGIPEPWDSGSERRAVALYPYPNAVGLYLAPITAYFFGRLLLAKQQRWFSVAVFTMGFFGIAASRTQGALAALFAAVVCAVAFTRFKKWAWGAALVLLIVGFIVPQSRAVLTFQDVSGQVRLAVWEGTVNLLKARPLLGAGLGGFPKVYDQYRLARHVELLEYPHNIFLDFWVELGVLGLAWLVIAFLKFFRNGVRGVRAKNTDAKILIVAMVAVLVYGLVDVPYFKNDLSVLFWTFLAMMTIATRRQTV